MKPRDPRRKVLIEARLRHGSGWADARIMDVSRRGLMVRASEIPERGTYVEICRGPHRIVARVVWARHDRFGARSQDAIAVDELVNGGPTETRPAANTNDRRTAPRVTQTGEHHDRSRHLARMAEFSVVVLAATAASVLAYGTIGAMLSKPMAIMQAALGLSALP